MADSLILMVLALVVFGPRRLPQIGRQIGKLMYEFRKASNDFKFQMEEELRMAEDADRRKKDEEERARNLALNPPAQTPAIEAQAGMGAVEQASVSAQPSPYPGEGAYPPATSASALPDVMPPQVRYPRIQPPSSGEPIPAAPPAAAIPGESPQPPADARVAAEANIGATPPVTTPEPTPDATGATATPTSEPTPTEPVSQHG